jgi:hypothetical protein
MMARQFVRESIVETIFERSAAGHIDSDGFTVESGAGCRNARA